MTVFFSPSRAAFFDDEIHGSRTLFASDDEVPNPNCTMPSDVIEISEDAYQAIIADLSDGPQKILSADEAGQPIAVAPPPPTVEEIAAQKTRDAKSALEASDIVAMRCIKAGVTFPAEWKSYCDALRDIVRGSTDAIPAHPSYPAGT